MKWSYKKLKGILEKLVRRKILKLLSSDILLPTFSSLNNTHHNLATTSVISELT